MKTLLLALLLTGCEAPVPIPEAPKAASVAPKITDLANEEDLQRLLKERFVAFRGRIDLVQHKVVSRGQRDGKPTELVQFKAVGAWASDSGADSYLCGFAALTYNAEWGTFDTIVGTDFLSSPDQPCSRDPKAVGQWGAQIPTRLSVTLKKNGYDLVLPP